MKRIPQPGDVWCCEWSPNDMYINYITEIDDSQVIGKALYASNDELEDLDGAISDFTSSDYNTQYLCHINDFKLDNYPELLI